MKKKREWFFPHGGNQKLNLSFKKMKLTLIFTMLVFFTFGNGFSQMNVTLHFEKATVQQVLETLEKQTGYVFLYKDEIFNPARRYSIDFTDVPFEEVLKSVSEKAGVDYEIRSNRQVILTKKEGALLTREVIQQQQRTITGVVTDQRGQPLPGVTIIVPGTTIGTVSNNDGEFSLNIPATVESLEFSFVGMQSMEVLLGGRTILTVMMEEESIGIQEIIAIGYGTQARANVIGSVATIKNEELTAAPVSRVSNALAGRLPGAIVQQRSGEPGADQASILIRGSATLGNNSPLIVIDGIQGRDLNSIQPDDIESITILKDASAAIYGSRAANGVILITTIRGKTDSPARFTYNVYQGFLSPTMLPKFTDAPTYATMIREMQSYRGIDESNMTFSLDDIAKYASGEYPWTHPNTNWMDESLKKYSSTRHHNVSVGGGTNRVRYFGSFGTQSDDAIYKNSDNSYDRYNLRTNIDIEVNDYISVGINISGSMENRMRPIRSSSDIYASIMRAKPTDHAVYPNGFLGPEAVRDQQPVITPSFALGFDDQTTYRSNNMMSANLNIPGIEGLTLSGYYAYDMYFMKRKRFEKPWSVYDFNMDAYLAAGNTGKEDGSEFLYPVTIGSEPQLNDYYDDIKTETVNLKLDYTKSFKSHNLSAFVAYESHLNEGHGINAFRRYFVTDQLPYLFAGGDAEKNNSGWVNVDAQVNYFGRLSYNYNETYLLQFSLRRDGSMRFSEETGRWGNFPSVLVGWRPSQYEWWQNSLGLINYFKLKASWGQMGNDLVPPFQYLASYSFGTGVVLNPAKNYVLGLYQTGTPNPLITWEVANVYNVGWESMLANNKIQFDVDMFYERRSNILVKRDASVPRFTGITLPDENFGIVDNKGFEVVLGYQNRQGSFSYGFSGNFSFVRNTIVEFDEPERSVPWQVRTGRPQGAALLYKFDGIFRDMDHVNSLPHVSGARPGDIIIRDVDGDGKITADDRILFDQTSNPEITYGLSFNTRYKNWQLTGLIQGVGNTMRRLYDDARQGSAGNYYQHDAIGRWTPENPNASKPRAFEREEEYWRRAYETDYAYVDVSYARLKNLQLSYKIPLNLKILQIREAELYFSGQNLLLLYTGNNLMDPELRGMNTYPIMKVLSLGAKINF
jgi:TonB-dependent starch-binding outer membrane protein SusC